MRRIGIVSMIVLMLSMLAFVPYSRMSPNELLKRKATPTPTTGPLPAPTLLSPPNGATVSGVVTLAWRAVPGAARYHLQAGLNPYHDEQSNIIDKGSLTDTSYTF